MKKLTKHFIGLLALSYFLFNCSGNDLPGPVCENSDLTIEATGTNPEDCASKGSIGINATGGKAPYTYSIDGGAFGIDNSFEELVAGTHAVSVKDARGCTASDDVVLTIPNSTLDIESATMTNATDCKESEGELTIVATGGAEPYSYSKNNIDYSNTTGIFAGLAAGTYNVFVKDADGCITSENNVRVRTNVSFNDDIKPILEANCIKSGCHNGDNGADINWSVFANVQAKAARIKLLTGNGQMPQDIAPTGLPQNERDLIACWVDDGALDN